MSSIFLGEVKFKTGKVEEFPLRISSQQKREMLLTRATRAAEQGGKEEKREGGEPYLSRLGKTFKPL